MYEKVKVINLKGSVAPQPKNLQVRICWKRNRKIKRIKKKGNNLYLEICSQSNETKCNVIHQDQFEAS